MKTSMDISVDCFALHKACQERYYIFPNLICQLSYELQKRKEASA